MKVTKSKLPHLSIAPWRLWLLRMGYLLIAAGMGSIIIPEFISPQPWELMEGAVNCMMLALVILSIIGLRYPLKMLPLLFWEVLWKITWLLAIALPTGFKMDSATQSMAFACSMVIIIVAVIPWDYVCRVYIRSKSV